MFEDLGGTLPLPTRVAMGISDILTSTYGVLVYAAMGCGLRVPALEEHRERQEDLGTYLPQDTGQDRGCGPEGRPRPLRPDAGNFKRGRRTDPAGDRDNGHLLW
jgi:hypothetical protein